MSINVLDFKKSLPLQGLHCRRFRRGKHALPQQLGFNDPVSPSWAVCFYFDAKISREPRSSTKRDQMWLSDPHGFAWYILILGYLNGLSWFISLSSLSLLKRHKMAIHVWDIHGYAMIYPIFRHLGAQAAAVPHAALGIEAAGAVPPWNRPQNHWASSKSGSVWT